MPSGHQPRWAARRASIPADKCHPLRSNRLALITHAKSSRNGLHSYRAAQSAALAIRAPRIKKEVKDVRVL